MNRRLFSLFRAPQLVATALVALACIGGSDDPPIHHPVYPVGTASARLTAPVSCNEMGQAIRADLLARIEVQTQRYLDTYRRGWGGMGCGGLASASEVGTSPDSAGGPTTKSAVGYDAENDGLEYSHTNTQFPTVDEADLVKTDGYRIYAAIGPRFLLLSAWPADETSVLASVEIEGNAHDLFVASGKAVVFSDTSDPRGLSADCSTCGLRAFTKVTQLDLAGDRPSVEREFYVRGTYQSARRHESTVRLVSTIGDNFFDRLLPGIDDFYRGSSDDFSLTEDERIAAIYAWREAAVSFVTAQSDVAIWTPETIERTDAGIELRTSDCSDAHVGSGGLSGDGVTQVVTFDIFAPERGLHRATVFGAPDAIFANEDYLVLAQTDHAAEALALWNGSSNFVGRTTLHVFRLNDDGVEYVASGFVDGLIVDQFSIDEHEGVIRVAVTGVAPSAGSERWSENRTAGRVITLSAEPKGDELQVLGTSAPMALGESVRSSRFLGDMAYVVTFPVNDRRGCGPSYDPLYAVDLSDPRNPRLLGEVEIPGFSTYVHPLDEDHLLTIGYETVVCGQPQGVTLQIFDVSSPLRPAVVQRLALARWSGSSEALLDHRAITFFPERSLVAFPMSNWSSSAGFLDSSLEVYSVNATTGLSWLGRSTHTDVLEETCRASDGWSMSPEVSPDAAVLDACQIRRGIFIEDYVYSLSAGGLRVQPIADMDHYVTTLDF